MELIIFKKIILPSLLILVLILVGGLKVQECNEIMNEAELSAKFQAFTEADSSEAAKRLLEKANERGMPILEHLTETGPEMREILDRMLAAAKS